MQENNTFKMKRLNKISYLLIGITLILTGLFIAGIVYTHHFGFIFIGTISLIFLFIICSNLMKANGITAISIDNDNITLTINENKKIFTKLLAVNSDIKHILLYKKHISVDLNDNTFFSLSYDDFNKNDWKYITSLITENFKDKVEILENFKHQKIFLKSMSFASLLITVLFPLLFLGITIYMSISIKQFTLLTLADILLVIEASIILILPVLSSWTILISKNSFFYLFENNTQSVFLKKHSFENLEKINFMYQKTKTGKKALPVIQFTYSDKAPYYIETYASKKDFAKLTDAINKHVSIESNNYVEEVKNKLKSYPENKKFKTYSVLTLIALVILIPLMITHALLSDEAPVILLGTVTISMFAMFAVFIIFGTLAFTSMNKVEVLKQSFEHVHVKIESDKQNESFNLFNNNENISHLTVSDGFANKLNSFVRESMPNGTIYYKKISENNYDAFYISPRSNSFSEQTEKALLQTESENISQYLRNKLGDINITCVVSFNFNYLSKEEKIFFANFPVSENNNGTNSTKIGLCATCNNTIYFNKDFSEFMNRTFFLY